MIASDAWLQVVCALLVLVLPSLAIAHVRPVAARTWVAAVVAALTAAIAVAAVDAGLGLRNDPPAALLDAALAASVTAVIVLVTAHRRGRLHAAVRSAIWGAFALAPMLIVSVGAVPSLLQRSLGALDAGGVVATHAAPAAAVLVAALMPVSRDGPASTGAGTSVAGTPAGRRPQGPTRSPFLRTAVAVALLTLSGVAWMVGVERVLSAATGRLAANAVAGILLGAVVWILSARIVGRPAPVGSALVGAALGWAAIGAGGAFLAPPALVAAAVIGPAAGAALVLRRRTASDPLARGAVAMVVSASVGGIIVGLLADGLGLAATGSIIGVGAQLISLLVVTIFSAAIALMAWAVASAVSWVLRRQSWWAIPDSN